MIRERIRAVGFSVVVLVLASVGWASVAVARGPEMDPEGWMSLLR